jgi:uncharacterized radical SAM protein YgiQ
MKPQDCITQSIIPSQKVNDTVKAAPFLPMSKTEMKYLGWTQCDVIIVSGDAYVDHPSFGMAVIGRTLEAHGYKVGIISQPDWSSAEAFKILGAPRLYFGITAGNMDSMINRYTSEKRLRHDDAYTPGNVGGKRPDRAVLVYSQRCREAYKSVPVVLGGIEASLRRIAHFDYWSEKVRRSALFDAKADILLYGNAERALIELTQRLDGGESIKEITNIRGTVCNLRTVPESLNLYEDHSCITNTSKQKDPKALEQSCDTFQVAPTGQPLRNQNSYIRLPSYEIVSQDKKQYALASRILHLETNPFNARALVQQHGNRQLWHNPPPLPLQTAEMDFVFGLDYARAPHPQYGNENIPAWEMIRFSINIMRGCFGGCTFCSITEHEGRIIQNRSKESILKEVQLLGERTAGFTGTVSDLGGPTANMYRLGCKDPKIEAACRKPSCIFPDICPQLKTDHKELIDVYQKTREVKGVKKVLIASGVRYDLAVKDENYVKELVSHHVGGYLKIAPEHTEKTPLKHMMKVDTGSWDAFKEMFDRFSRQADKIQYLIPYFMSAHPGTSDMDMVNLALWLKKNRFKLDQVQNFYPTPMSTATTMYHTGINSLAKVAETTKSVGIPFGTIQRRLHKAILRYHDPKNWPLIRAALKKMGRSDLIGRNSAALVPEEKQIPRKSFGNADPGSKKKFKPSP